MADRYVAVPRSAYVQWHSNEHSSVTADECIVPEGRRIKTGLLDADGRDLYREPETVPLGFDFTRKR